MVQPCLQLFLWSHHFLLLMRLLGWPLGLDLSCAWGYQRTPIPALSSAPMFAPFQWFTPCLIFPMEPTCSCCSPTVDGGTRLHSFIPNFTQMLKDLLCRPGHGVDLPWLHWQFRKFICNQLNVGVHLELNQALFSYLCAWALKYLVKPSQQLLANSHFLTD